MTSGKTIFIENKNGITVWQECHARSFGFISSKRMFRIGSIYFDDIDNKYIFHSRDNVRLMLSRDDLSPIVNKLEDLELARREK